MVDAAAMKIPFVTKGHSSVSIKRARDLSLAQLRCTAGANSLVVNLTPLRRRLHPAGHQSHRDRRFPVLVRYRHYRRRHQCL